MKSRTINLVDAIDRMDKVNSYDEEWAKGNEFYFICKNIRSILIG